MCTVSSIAFPRLRTVFFNRDEKHTRSAEEPPALWPDQPIPFLAPRDPDGGGTWFGVNRAGLVVAFLNHEEAPARTGAAPSRGQLALTLLACRTPEEAGDCLTREAAAYRPFLCLLLDRVTPPCLWTHNGTAPPTADPHSGLPPATTSSFEPARVRAARLAQFASIVDPTAPTAEQLEAFHQSVLSNDGAGSVLMLRPDAATRSVIHLDLGPGLARLAWRIHDTTTRRFGAPLIRELPLEPLT